MGTTKSNLSNVVNFPQSAKGTGAPDIAITEETGVNSGFSSRFIDDGGSSSGMMPLDSLYPLLSKVDPQKEKIRSLLDESINLVDEALNCHHEADLMTADCNVQMLPEKMAQAFLMKNDMEGLGLIVSNIFYALKNKKGELLTIEELESIRLTLFRIRQSPYMSFEDALELIEIHIEKVGFNIEPEFSQNIAVCLGI